MPKKLTDLAAATALEDADQLWIEQSGTSKRIAADVFQLPLNYIAGLITSNDTDTDHDIAIAPGVARGAADDANLRLAAILTKQIEATWAVGDDAGGMESADHPVQVDTLYALWLIKRPDTGVVDAMFSLDFSAPTLPTNYTKKRLIAAVMTDGSANIIEYLQSGDYFRYMGAALPQDVDDNTMTTNTYETGTLSVPPSAMAHIYGHVNNPTEASTLIRMAIKTKGAGEGGGLTEQSWAAQRQAADNTEGIGCIGQVLVDANSQIEYACSEAAGTATVEITTLGFTMFTRSNP